MNATHSEKNDDGTSEATTSDHRFAGAIAPAAAWGFVFLILRLFAVSNYDWHTAFNVSTTLGPSDFVPLVFGTLMGGHWLVEILLIMVLPLLLATYFWAPRGHRSLLMLATTMGLVTLVALTLSFRNWWLPVATAAVCGLFTLIHFSSSKNRLRRAFTRVMGRVGWVSGVALVLISALVQTPWVPQEHIETTDGPMTAYVLGVESGFLNLLTEDHEFVILKRDKVISRT